MRRKHKAMQAVVRAAVASAALSLGAAAPAEPVDDATRQPDRERLRTRTLAAGCAQCHGTDGRGGVDAAPLPVPAAPAVSRAAAMPAMPALPTLAGTDAPTLIAQMRAFQRNDVPGTVMGQIARGYSDAQIADLASYFAGVRP